MKKASIQVLLPTYNGARYLHEQLESLCRQTCRQFSVVTYDDGSSDESIAIVDSFKNRLTIERVSNNSNGNSGAVKSFELLLQHSTADTILFCDQDDIWEPAKIEQCTNALSSATATYGAVPLAVFSDLTLFSETDTTVGGSFLASTGFNAAALCDPYYLTFRNPAPGCSMAINRELIKAALPFGSMVLMHDWWLMLTAVHKGTIVFIDKPLIRYRIHASNTLGIAQDRPTPSITVGCKLDQSR